MNMLLQDPAFWYSVSFFLFVALVAKRGMAFVNQSLERYQNEIQSKYEQAIYLYKEALVQKKAIEKDLKNWPDEQKKLEREYKKKVEHLKTTMKLNFEKSKERRVEDTKKYIEFKRLEAQKRLENQISENITQNVLRLLT
jgi:F0F1-type ATP synthase membrane subunit b/b'